VRDSTTPVPLALTRLPYDTCTTYWYLCPEFWVSKWNAKHAKTQNLVFFSENAPFTETFIDEGEAEADVEDLVFSDDVTFVGDTLELVCNIADNAANTFTDGTPKPPLECHKCKKIIQEARLRPDACGFMLGKGRPSTIHEKRFSSLSSRPISIQFDLFGTVQNFCSDFGNFNY
jgi:hypothetical protein